MPNTPVPVGAALLEGMLYGTLEYLPLHPHVEDAFHQPLVRSKGRGMGGPRMGGLDLASA